MPKTEQTTTKPEIQTHIEPMLSLETIAYEEAGHAVAAIILDVQFIDVTISALGGHVRPKGQRQFEDRYFIVSLAGPAARVRFDPDSAWADQRPEGDIPLVRAIMSKYSWSDFDDVNAKAQRLIDTHWPEVERVVQALLKDKTLSADAVRAAMTGASRGCRSRSCAP